MILIDANVPMYLAGADPERQVTARRLLDRAANNHERLVTDAEVFQEILHRYAAIKRHEAIQPAFDVLHEVVDEIFPIDAAVIERAKTVVLGYKHLSARDAIHIAAMREHGVTRIMSFDTGFDSVSGLTRLSE